MAGPSVVVRFLADLTGLNKAATDTGTAAQGAASKMASAFHGVIGSLNQTGVLGPFSGALDGIGHALDTMAEHGKTAGAVMAGVGAGVAGVGVALSAMGSKDQAAHQQLQAAVEATGKSYDDYSGQVDKAIKKQENYGHTANQTQDALRIMTQAMGDPAKALQYLGEASDLAAAKHESLDTAATQLSRTYNGANRLLKEFGVETLPKASTAATGLTTAQKGLETATTAQANAHQHLADVQALLAGKTHLTTAEQIQLRDAHTKVAAADMAVLDAHTKVTTATDNVQKSTHNAATTMDELGQKLRGQAAAQADTFTGKLDALKAHMEDMAAKFGSKYGPAIQIFGVIMATAGTMSLAAWGWLVLVIAAVAALIAIAYVLYTNWDTIWAGIQSIVKTVWDWIKKNWPLLLAIITGPFGLAVYFIVDHWNAIMKFFKGVIDDVKKIFEDIWGGIVDAFKDVINAVIDVWNDLHFTLPKVDILGVHIGGEKIGVPTIPHMAQGGIVTAPTLALLGENGPEVVTPLGRGGTSAVHIDNATFNDPADIDLLMEKVAFATAAGRL